MTDPTETAKLREALRAQVIRPMNTNTTQCQQCLKWWPFPGPEHHAPGCLAEKKE